MATINPEDLTVKDSFGQLSVDDSVTKDDIVRQLFGDVGDLIDGIIS